MIDFIIMNRQKKNLDKLYMILSMAIFGTIGLFTRYTLVPSAVLAFLRGSIGTLVLLLAMVVLKKKHDFKVIKSKLLFLSVSGAMIGFNWVFLFEAYKYTTVSVATLCYYMAPIIVMLTSPLLFKEKLSLVKILCIISAFIGCIMISGVLENGFTSVSEYKGILFGLMAAMLYAAIIILNKKNPGINPYDKTATQLFFASIVMLPYIIITGNVIGLCFTPLSITIILLLGIVHTGIAYALYFKAVESLEAQTVAFLSYIDPIVAILISVFILKEGASLLSVIGAFLILGAAFISDRSK